MIVKNVSKDPKKFLVARYSFGELWFWGSYDTFDRAIEVALKQNGQVIPLEYAECEYGC